MNKARFEALSDRIFAFAVTLLILGVAPACVITRRQGAARGFVLMLV